MRNTARRLQDANGDVEGQEYSAFPSIASNIRKRNPDLRPEEVEDMATFWGTLKDGLYRKTGETVPSGDPVTRVTRERRHHEKLDQTRPAPMKLAVKIARRSPVGHAATTRALHALLGRLEGRRGPQSLPRKEGR